MIDDDGLGFSEVEVVGVAALMSSRSEGIFQQTRWVYEVLEVEEAALEALLTNLCLGLILRLSRCSCEA